MKTQSISNFRMFINLFTKTGQSVNRHVNELKLNKQKNRLCCSIYQRNLKNSKKALLITYPMRENTYNKGKDVLIVFQPDNTKIIKTYESFSTETRKVYTTTTEVYKKGIPFSNEKITKLFLNNKLYTVFNSHKK